MNNAAENRRKKALLIVNPCAGKNRTRSDLGEIINAFPDGVFDFTIKSAFRMMWTKINSIQISTIIS